MIPARWLLIGAVVVAAPLHLLGQTDSTSLASDSSQVIRTPDIQTLLSATFRKKSVIAMDSLALYRIWTHDDLMNVYHEDLADFLWLIGGMYVHDLGSYGKPITASFNGLSNRQLLILFDGVLLNESDVEWMNLNQISLENIERIEFYRGTIAGRYGAAGTAGYVNIISRRFPSETPITSLKYRSVFSDFGDIGVFFGRNFGSRVRAYIGGSSKETPGEQYVQGLKGGFIQNLQQTRYNGTQWFGGFDYLVNDKWSFRFHMQSSRDKYDAYGRNVFGDRKAFDFTTVGGRRTDNRTDYQFVLTRTGDQDVWENRWLFSDINRDSKNFVQTEIPTTYRSRRVSAQSQYHRQWGRHGWQAGFEYEANELGRLPDGTQQFDRFALFASDMIDLNSVYVQPAFRTDFHVDAQQTTAGSVGLIIPFGKWKWTTRAGWSEDIASPLASYLHKNVQKASETGVGLNEGSVPDLQKERIVSFLSTLEVVDLIMDRISVSLYENRWENGFFYEPIGFFTDSTSLQLRQKGRGTTHGMDVEMMHELWTIQWTLRQTFFTGDYELRSGLPPYRTWISGYSERVFFNKNLKVTGFLSASYLSHHDGFTFQDAPQAYYLAPRRARGGWILNTRISAHIGDFQLFYEAENFPRVRFTMLDGYDVTPQQVRVGLIWTLFN